jgi:hypothetical protein
MPKTIIFSLDYDGCSDILFQEIFIKYEKHLRDLRPEQRLNIDMALKEAKNELANFLDKKAQEAEKVQEVKEVKAKEAKLQSVEQKSVEVYIGSNRQSHALEAFNMSSNENGSCFTNLQKLCEEKSWIFRKLLLADVENNQGEGSAFVDKRLTCTFDKTKIETLQNQLKHVANKHRTDEVHFYFLDDDNKDSILPALRKKFEDGEEIFENIHLHLIKFDWYAKALEKKEGLKEVAYIQGKKQYGVTVKDEKKADPTYPKADPIYPDPTYPKADPIYPKADLTSYPGVFFQPSQPSGSAGQPVLDDGVYSSNGFERAEKEMTTCTCCVL